MAVDFDSLGQVRQNIILLRDVLGPRPKLLGFIDQVWPLSPTCQRKSSVEGQRKEACCRAQGHLGWKGKGSFQLSSQDRHLLWFRWENLSVERQVCVIIKQSQSQMCSGGHRWQPQVVWQLIVSGLVRWDVGTIRAIAAWQVLFFYCSVLPGFQEDCEVTAGENGSERRTQIQNGGGDAKLFSAFS
jgi:hypothetical protein